MCVQFVLFITLVLYCSLSATLPLFCRAADVTSWTFALRLREDKFWFSCDMDSDTAWRASCWSWSNASSNWVVKIWARRIRAAFCLVGRADVNFGGLLVVCVVSSSKERRGFHDSFFEGVVEISNEGGRSPRLNHFLMRDAWKGPCTILASST